MSRAFSLQENSVTYLCNLVNNLPKSIPGSTIQSLYLSRCCEIAERESMKLPEILYSRLRCPRCFVQYASGSHSNKIQKTRRKNKFAQKLIKKVENEKALTSYQKRYLKISKNKANFNSTSLVETCSFCNHKRKIALKKPAKIVNKVISVPTKIKKKKKKDKFAGLNKDVVLNIQKSDANKSDFKASANNSSKNAVPPQKELSRTAKKRKLMDLKNMLRDFKEEKTPTSLQQFLTSI